MLRPLTLPLCTALLALCAVAPASAAPKSFLPSPTVLAKPPVSPKVAETAPTKPSTPSVPSFRFRPKHSEDKQNVELARSLGLIGAWGMTCQTTNPKLTPSKFPSVHFDVSSDGRLWFTETLGKTVTKHIVSTLRRQGQDGIHIVSHGPQLTFEYTIVLTTEAIRLTEYAFAMPTGSERHASVRNTTFKRCGPDELKASEA
jgi:hypothetical protein